jgi:C-terminal processing protease CtpA/Prc
MSEIADADAVIVDLRNNHGGAPETVAFIASYFFEPRAVLLTRIQRRDTGQTREFWTRPDLPGRRFGATRPVYVLTSVRTFSGGEGFAYALQAQQRAIVVGEVTAGGAHPTEPRPIDAGLHVMVPWGRSINPITHSNWEGTGVQPDLASTAELALERALQDLEHRKRQQLK